jgi:hypothetical protein
VLGDVLDEAALPSARRRALSVALLLEEGGDAAPDAGAVGLATSPSAANESSRSASAGPQQRVRRLDVAQRALEEPEPAPVLQRERPILDPLDDREPGRRRAAGLLHPPAVGVRERLHVQDRRRRLLVPELLGAREPLVGQLGGARVPPGATLGLGEMHERLVPRGLVLARRPARDRRLQHLARLVEAVRELQEHAQDDARRVLPERPRELGLLDPNRVAQRVEIDRLAGHRVEPRAPDDRIREQDRVAGAAGSGRRRVRRRPGGRDPADGMEPRRAVELDLRTETVVRPGRERLVERLHGVGHRDVAARLHQPHQHAGPLGARRSGEGELEQRPRRAEITGPKVELRRRDPPPPQTLAVRARRAPDGELRQFGGRRPRTPARRPPCSLVERRRDRSVAALRRQSQMASALLVVLDDRGESRMQPAPFVRRDRGVGGVGEQRTREADAAAVELEHARLDRGVEAATIPAARADDLVDAGECQRGGDVRRVRSCGRQLREPFPEQTSEIVRHRIPLGPGGAAAPEVRSAELERMKWISRCALVKPHQARPRDRQLESRHQQPMGRAEAHPPDGHQLDVAKLEAADDAGPASGERGDGLVAESPQREPERVGRSPVEPLCVVDREQQRPLPREQRNSPSVATAIARGSGGTPPASSSSSATESGRRCGGGSPASSSPRPAKRSPSPANDNSRSGPDTRASNTRTPRALASSTAERQSSVFPIPASPSSTSPAGLSEPRSRNAVSRASSSALPMIRPSRVSTTRPRIILPATPTRQHAGPGAGPAVSSPA